MLQNCGLGPVLESMWIPGYQLKTKGVTIEESTIEKLGTTLGMDHIKLWNNFSTFPPGVMPWSVGNWLKQLLAA
jgi:hypothetical protein